MGIRETAEKHRVAQKIAKDTMLYLSEIIRAGMTVREIVELAEDKLKKAGADSFWYYNAGALVYAGGDTVKSISGKDYKPAKRKIKRSDIITIDLSPAVNGFWGDYARTLIVKNEVVVGYETDSFDFRFQREFHMVMMILAKIRRLFRDYITPVMSFSEMHIFIMQALLHNDCINLDFNGNFGHTIPNRLEDRVYILKDCPLLFGAAGLFTFEPHIKIAGGGYGVKTEDIYYFEGGELKIL